MSNILQAENLTKRGRGRPKGVPNKIGKAAKDMIAEVAEGLGGADGMLAWAKEDKANEKAFWTQVYPKLIPVQLQGDAENPLLAIIERRIVKAGD